MSEWIRTDGWMAVRVRRAAKSEYFKTRLMQLDNNGVQKKNIVKNKFKKQ